MPPSLTKEARAYHELAELLESADAVRKQFVAAGIPLPPSLARLFEDQSNDSVNTEAAGHSGRKRPAVATDEWIWVSLSDLPPQQFVLAILRDANRAMPPAEVVLAIKAYQPDVNAGTVYNVGPRLIEAGVLSRSEEGWVLLEPEHAPLIHDDAAWGPVEVYGKQEVAGYRRCLICEVLDEWSPDGLNVTQLVSVLKKKWPHILANKDLLKMDMLALEAEGVTKRFGSLRKWIKTNE